MSEVDIKVSEDLIRGIIETKVQTAITEALSEESSVVENVVTAALTQKVSSTGSVSRYATDNKFSYLDVLCKKLIREAAEAAIARWVVSRKEVLEKEFLRQLQTKKTSSLMVRACVEGLTGAVKEKWRFSVSFTD